MLLLNVIVNAQVVFINNPSNHIVAYNPAFSAINPLMNTNYVPDQIAASYRTSKRQSDILATGQYFFGKKNIGISAQYQFMNQEKLNSQKVGLGLSYHLIFFNSISTGWGVGISYHNLYADSNASFSVYNEKRNGVLQSGQYASLTFGGLINYEQWMLGFSIQPNTCIYVTSPKKGTSYTMGSLNIKYRKPINRRVNTTFWYLANWNTISNLQFLNSEIYRDKIQSHSLNVHVAGEQGLIGGMGFRVTNFNYTSLVAKVGYNTKHFQVLYGLEPYWLHGKYSEIIHELSFILKFN